MNKDVIYIDVEDDITAIIGKIKDSKEKIVALVPPRRVGILQSAVNLRLLDRMAKDAGKNLVLVTNNAALIALSTSAKIPVAKNLQSKPELAEVPALAVDDDDDIIDGSQLPVGDLAEASDEPEAVAAITAPVKTRRPELSTPQEEVIEGISIDEPIVKKATPKTKKVKIPNYDKFRKRLFFGITGAVVLAALLVWMYVIAPAATVIITAQTTPSQVSATLSLGGSAATDYKSGLISSVSQSSQSDATVKFTPTGTATTGDKATGQIKFQNCDSNGAATLPAGTTVAQGGLDYTTQAAVTVPAGGPGETLYSCNPGVSAPVAIQAADIGSDYNTDSGTAFSVPGHKVSQGYFSATASTDIAGGDSKQVTVVSQDDVDKAQAQLQGQSSDSAKKSLENKFKNGETVIDSSFTAAQGTQAVSPAVGQQLASGQSQATLTVPTTYTMIAVPKQALDAYLQSALQATLTDKNQKIYDNGDKGASFTGFLAGANGAPATATLTATGQTGPSIDETQIKKIVAGQKYGTIEEQINQDTFPGVQNVDVKYSFPWVSHVPNNQSKITVQFKVQNGK